MRISQDERDRAAYLSRHMAELDRLTEMNRRARLERADADIAAAEARAEAAKSAAEAAKGEAVSALAGQVRLLQTILKQVVTPEAELAKHSLAELRALVADLQRQLSSPA